MRVKPARPRRRSAGLTAPRCRRRRRRRRPGPGWGRRVHRAGRVDDVVHQLDLVQLVFLSPPHPHPDLPDVGGQVVGDHLGLDEAAEVGHPRGVVHALVCGGAEGSVAVVAELPGDLAEVGGQVELDLPDGVGVLVVGQLLAHLQAQPVAAELLRAKLLEVSLLLDVLARPALPLQGQQDLLHLLVGELGGGLHALGLAGHQRRERLGLDEHEEAEGEDAERDQHLEEGEGLTGAAARGAHGICGPSTGSHAMDCPGSMTSVVRLTLPVSGSTSMV